RVVCGNRSAEPSRSGVNEQPKATPWVSVELEEMISAAERPQVPPGKTLAGVLERPCRQRPCEDLVGHLDTTPSMDRVARRDRAIERLNDRFELGAVASPGVIADLNRGHAAP